MLIKALVVASMVVPFFAFDTNGDGKTGDVKCITTTDAATHSVMTKCSIPLEREKKKPRQDGDRGFVKTD